MASTSYKKTQTKNKMDIPGAYKRDISAPSASKPCGDVKCDEGKIFENYLKLQVVTNGVHEYVTKNDIKNLNRKFK